MNNQLERAINLIRKTGDRLLISDKNENVYALMSLDQYENLFYENSGVRGLTEDEMLDKINRDIAIWKSDQDFEDYGLSADDFLSDIRDNSEHKIGSLAESAKTNHWRIPGEIKEGAEEIIDEDRQYLEEI